MAADPTGEVPRGALRRGRVARLVARAVAVVLCVIVNPCVTAAESGGGGSDLAGEAFRLRELNPSLPDLDDQPNLATPQACVENFLLSARAEEWGRAARSLNFGLVGEVSEAEAERLARRFFFVLNQELWVDWSLLPDRRDGVNEGSMMGTNAPMAGQPRRSIALGEIGLEDRAVPIRLQRVIAGDTQPRWVFSAQTVANIDELYARHGPSPVAERLPGWARERWWGRLQVWQWLALGALLVAAPLAGLVVSTTILPWIARRVPGRASQLVDHLEWPVGVLTTLALATAALEGLLALPAAVGGLASLIVTVGLVAAGGWTIARSAHFAIEFVAKDAIRWRTDADSNSRRRVLTQLTVVRHVVIIGVACVAVAVVLIEYNVFRTVGIALLTSAGAAAVVLGIAGHTVLGNLIAGLQIALTRPFRVDDTVFIEGNWGRIEDITYTYVIVNTWDERRLVLPIQYFVRNPFENWARNDRFLMKPIYLRVDFRADVERIRKRFMELIESDDNWAGERDDPTVLVTDSDDETVLVRLTAGGESSSAAWRLSCRTRERLIAWLRDVEDGAWLPRRRVMLNGSVDGADSGDGRSRPAGVHAASGADRPA